MRRLAQAIGEYAGLDPPAWLLEARVHERAEELGLDESVYLERVTADPRERACLLERLRVGETRFFRHHAQIDALRTRVLPALLAQPTRAWSAGCATGEEAFTLAMLCYEAAPRGEWEVMATDLSAAAIAVAESGEFPSKRLDEVPPPYRHHLVVHGSTMRVRPELRARIRFAQQNLVEARALRAIDLVLCRNVMIYFDAGRRAEVIARLGEALRPGGWLFLGYSEMLRGAEEARLEPVHVGECVLYRRREVTAKLELPVEDQDTSAPPPVALAPPEPPLLKLRGEYPDGTRLAAELRPFLAESAVVDLDGAHFLGDEAARVLQRARQAAPRLVLRATRAPILRWLNKHGLFR